MKMPSAAPVPRVPRSRRDDYYQTGHPAPVKRASAGWVQSVQDDTCSVLALDELLTGVIYLGDPPEVGDIVEIEARGDLLCIPRWFEGPSPPEWLELGTSIIRIAESTGYTQEVDQTSGSMNAFSGMAQGYEVVRAFITPDPPVYQRSDAWDCVWLHTQQASTAGSQRYNNPPDDFEWHGSYICKTPIYHAAYDIGWHGPTWSNRTVGWSCTASWPSWQNQCNADSRGIAYSIDVPAILDGFGPEAGFEVPVPPPGMVLEWEDADSELVQLDATLVEPTSQAATNTGEVYAAIYRPGAHGFGPDPTDSSHWKNAAGFDNIVCLGPWSGATDEWTDITALAEGSGRTWFTIVPPSWAVGDELARPDHETTISEVRWGMALAVRLHLRASRYRFVPEPTVTSRKGG